MLESHAMKVVILQYSPPLEGDLSWRSFVVLMLFVFSLVFFIGAVFEEKGWRLTWPPNRLSLLLSAASLVLAVFLVVVWR